MPFDLAGKRDNDGRRFNEMEESGSEYEREDQKVRESVGRLSCTPLRSVVEGPKNAPTSIKHHRQFEDQVDLKKFICTNSEGLQEICYKIMVPPVRRLDGRPHAVLRYWAIN